MWCRQWNWGVCSVGGWAGLGWAPAQLLHINTHINRPAWTTAPHLQSMRSCQR